MRKSPAFAMPGALLLSVFVLTGLSDVRTWGVLDPFLEPDGVWNPANDHQRFRAGEYPGDFYQWWYFGASDAQTSTSFAFAYHYNDSPSNPGLEGLYVVFSMFSPGGNFSVYYRYPLSAVTGLGNQGHMSFADGLHRILPGPAGGTVRAIGLMNDPASLWAYDQTSGMTAISPRTVIGWDVTFSRIAGCYIGAELERSPVSPDTLWNTYQFDALVSGCVTIDGTPHVFSPAGTRFRGYCDQNFGVDMPHGTPDIRYRWGWFSARHRHEDPAQDVAVIAGLGISDHAMGLPFDVEGFYAAAYNTLVRNVAWKQAVGSPFRHRVPLGQTCGWGRSLDRYVECRVVESAWLAYSDSFGTASVPGRQRVTLDGEHIRVIMDFQVSAGDIQRLLIPYKRGLWSDFEAWGADCVVNIYEKAYRWYDVFRCFPILVLSDSFVDHQAGVEYGYFVPGVAIPAREQDPPEPAGE